MKFPARLFAYAGCSDRGEGSWNTFKADSLLVNQGYINDTLVGALLDAMEEMDAADTPIACAIAGGKIDIAYAALKEIHGA